LVLTVVVGGEDDGAAAGAVGPREVRLKVVVVAHDAARLVARGCHVRRVVQARAGGVGARESATTRSTGARATSRAPHRAPPRRRRRGGGAGTSGASSRLRPWRIRPRRRPLRLSYGEVSGGRYWLVSFHSCRAALSRGVDAYAAAGRFL
jgi:hypothetical protein